MLLSDKCSRSGSYKLIGQFCCNVNTTFASELTSALDEAIRISEKVICTGDLYFDTMNPPKITKKEKCPMEICLFTTSQTQPGYLRIFLHMPFAVADEFSTTLTMFIGVGKNHTITSRPSICNTDERCPSLVSKLITTCIRKAMRDRDRLKKKFHTSTIIAIFLFFLIISFRFLSMPFFSSVFLFYFLSFIFLAFFLLF